MNNTKITDKRINWYKGGIIYFALLLMMISCDNSNMVSETTKEKSEMSQIDNEPIVKLQADEFYHGSVLDNIRDNLAENHGSAIVKALNEQRNQQDFQIGTSILIQKLNSLISRKADAPEIGSTHLRVTEPDGESEDFVLSLRRYHQNPATVLRKGSTRLKSSTTYLALSPDRFYLQDDENGNEQWPVTFPAVSLDDPTDKISLTFNKDGFVSSSFSDASKGNAMASEEQPDIVFAEATPIIDEPTDIDPCYPDCGGGDGGGGYDPPRQDDNSRGDDPRTPNLPGMYPPERTYFVVHSIKLAKEGDGDGATDLQMFVQKSDDYDGQNMPLKYRYRFDNAWRVDPTCNCNIASNNTKIEGADRHVYEVPDINNKGVKYDFVKRWVSPIGSDNWWSVYVGFYPLIDLTSHPANWRVVMSDDDKDYRDFSRRRQSEYHPNIHTYSMSGGTYSSVETGFTVDRKTYGSSDDPHWGSGVRKVTINNVQSQINGGQVVVQTIIEGNQFEYIFGLETYDPRQI